MIVTFVGERFRLHAVQRYSFAYTLVLHHKLCTIFHLHLQKSNRNKGVSNHNEIFATS